ncbi:Mitochondrial import inner membrane translocase subunit TIM14-1 [Linum perenne]
MYSGGCCLWCQVYDSGMARFQDEAKGILPRRVSVQHDKARSSAYTWNKREKTPAKDVKDAYKKVMKANHPDQGGSDYLSNKINEAKNVMLGGQNSSSAF